MKKVLLSLLAITLSFGVFAQDTTSGMNYMQQHNMKPHEGIWMKNGKLMVWENGQATQLTQDRTLSNGTLVMTDGTVKKSDGTTQTLREGDFISMDGTISNGGKWKMKDKNGREKMKSNMNSTDTLK